MRILHLATSKGGGAGIAAHRLHDALLENGYDSIFLTLEQTNLNQSHKHRIDFVSRKLYTLINKLNTRKGYALTTTFSHNSISYKDIDEFNPDVIHIHNWYNLISPEFIAKIADKYPTLITLHDERIYTGACHYTLECNNFQTDCSYCPAVHSFQKKIVSTKIELPAALSPNSRLGAVAPSQWLLDRLQNTSLSQKIQLSKCIANIIPTGIAKNNDNKRIFSEQKLHILFTAVNPDHPTKGLDMLVDAATQLALDSPDLKITLSIVGKPTQIQSRSKNLTILIHGFLTHPELVNLLVKVDLAVVPSLVDNSPSVISEAQLSGVLVLATRVGGIPELIEDSKTGLLCEPNTSSLKQAILKSQLMQNRDEISRNGRDYATERHDSKKIVSAHVEMYLKLMNND